MATTLFDLEISISSPEVTTGLSKDAKKKLFRKPSIEQRKSKNAGSVTRNTVEGPVESDVLELEEISEAYSELIIRGQDILSRLKERLADLTYVFEEDDQPALVEAMGRVFQNSPTNITYNMYLTALQLDKDIAVEIGERESGFIKQYS